MGQPIIVAAPPPVWDLEIIAPAIYANQTDYDDRAVGYTPYTKVNGMGDPTIVVADTGGTNSHKEWTQDGGTPVVLNYSTGAQSLSVWAHPFWWPPLAGTFLGPTLGRYRYAWLRAVCTFGTNDVAYGSNDGPGLFLFAYGGSGTVSGTNSGPSSTNPRALAGFVPVPGTIQGVRAATFDTAGGVLDASSGVEVGGDFFTVDFLITAAGVNRAASLIARINEVPVGTWTFDTASLLLPTAFTSCRGIAWGFNALNEGTARTFAWQGWHLRCGQFDIDGAPVAG